MKALSSLLLAAAALWGYGEGVVYWQPHACQTHGKPSKHGSHGMETTMFQTANLDANGSAVLISPDLSERTVPLASGTLTLPKLSTGGYYALVFEQRSESNVSGAIRYLSHMGRPAKEKISPTRLTALSKTELEIVPSPLHREHDRYSASKTYRFIVMFRKEPLPYARLRLETQNGFSSEYVTDAEGKIEITLPNDFKNVRSERSANRPGEFLLTTLYTEGKTSYESTLSMPYYVNPNDFWQSQKLGAGAIALGFLGGMILYRRSQKGSKNG